MAEGSSNDTGYLEGVCEDFPFEDSSSSDEQEVEFDADDEVEEEDDTEELGIRPYQFEPMLPADAERNRLDDEIADDRMGRLNELDWCSCGHCILMTTVTESVCCHEIPRMAEKFHETDPPLNCITDHEEFRQVALLTAVLDLAYIGYSRRERQQVQGPPHQRYRYTAYRQIVRWVWRILGRSNRVVLPSCVVEKIGIRFPPPPGVAKTGFRYAPNQ